MTTIQTEPIVKREPIPSAKLLCPRTPVEAPAPGRYTDKTFEEYLNWAAVSNSMMDFVLTSPFHCDQWRHTTGEEEKKCYEEGKAVHTAILEPDHFARELVVLPAINKKSSTQRDEREEFKRSQREKMKSLCLVPIFLEQEEVEAVMAQVRAVKRNHALSMALATPGNCEVCYVWIDEYTGLPCKARIDREVGTSALLDLKKARSAARDNFGRAMLNYGYHRQAFFYKWGASCIGRAVEEFIFGAVETVEGNTPDEEGRVAGRPPTAIAAAYRIDEASLSVGYSMTRQALNLIAECLTADSWPGYADDLQDIGLPMWALQRFHDGEDL